MRKKVKARKSMETLTAEMGIWFRALEAKNPTPDQALKLYADPACWVQIHAKDKDGKPRCYWAWGGLIVPPYELARNTLVGLCDKRKAKP